MASQSSSTPLLRSISDIITSLKNSPGTDVNFKQAELELLAKEKHARCNYDVLEEKYSCLSLQVLHFEGENRRLARECEVHEHQVSDLAALVEVMKEREDKCSKRYQRAQVDIDVLEREKGEICRELEKVQSCLMERVRMLEDDVEDLRTVLGEKNDKVCEYEDKIRNLKMVIDEKDNEVDGLKRFLSEKDKEIVVLRRKIDACTKISKEMEKTMEVIEKKSSGQCKILVSICEDYRSDKAFFEERYEDNGGEREGRIKELKKKLECLKMKAREIMNENDK